ncbi:MAG TPA: hypothetical protein VKT32_09590 [Chthonomonadaceae bacterium]|nr:hypothetical protein [Chthonomonadaceae bacterium]
MFLRNRAFLAVALLGALAACGGAAARADVIVSNQSVTPNGSNFTWTYDVNLTNDETVQINSFFTIYDFRGFVPGTDFGPSGWIFSSANLGKTPSRVTPTDNPHVPNLTWTYSGSTIGPGPVDLGQFGADSTLSSSTLGEFATEAIKYAPGKPGNGTPVDNIGSVGVPSVPEVDSLVLLLPGLVPLGMLLRRRA